MTEETVAFANALIFDGVSAELREGCVRVAAGTIADVAEGPGPGDRVIDCRGRTIIPGLIDAHFHAYGASLSLLEIETSPLSYLALAGARRLADALGRGFTTVRDPGGGDAGLARAVREGLTTAPRYLFCGPALSQTGGHGDPRPPELDCCLGGGHMAEVVDGVDALRRAARERLRSGAHAIKIMASGGVISPSDPLRVPQYSPEEIRVVAEEAGRRGSYVAAHAYSAEAIGVAVANGVRSIEHGNLLDDAGRRLDGRTGRVLGADAGHLRRDGAPRRRARPGAGGPGQEPRGPRRRPDGDQAGPGGGGPDRVRDRPDGRAGRRAAARAAAAGRGRGPAGFAQGRHLGQRGTART